MPSWVYAGYLFVLLGMGSGLGLASVSAASLAAKRWLADDDSAENIGWAALAAAGVAAVAGPILAAVVIGSNLLRGDSPLGGVGFGSSQSAFSIAVGIVVMGLVVAATAATPAIAVVTADSWVSSSDGEHHIDADAPPDVAKPAVASVIRAGRTGAMRY